jgi:hypothetical protein
LVSVGNQDLVFSLVDGEEESEPCLMLPGLSN